VPSPTNYYASPRLTKQPMLPPRPPRPHSSAQPPISTTTTSIINIFGQPSSNDSATVASGFLLRIINDDLAFEDWQNGCLGVKLCPRLLHHSDDLNVVQCHEPCCWDSSDIAHFRIQLREFKVSTDGIATMFLQEFGDACHSQVAFPKALARDVVNLGIRVKIANSLNVAYKQRVI